MFAGRYFGARQFGRRYFGKTGLVVDGAYFGTRHYGSRYFGQRYFGHNATSLPFAITQTAGVSVSGTLGVAGGLTFGADFTVAQTAGIGLTGVLATSSAGFNYEGEVFYFTPPLQISGLTGTIAVAGDITITAPAAGYGGYWGRRYFGGRFYGPRYFGVAAAWPLTQTAGIGLNGSLNVAGGIVVPVAIAQTSGIGLTGSLTVEGGIDIASRPSGGYKPVASGPKKRNYIVQGQKFYDLTTEELAQVVAQMGRVKRKEVKVQAADQKPKTVDSATWQEVKPHDDDEDVLLLL